MHLLVYCSEVNFFYLQKTHSMSAHLSPEILHAEQCPVFGNSAVLLPTCPTKLLH